MARNYSSIDELIGEVVGISRPKESEPSAGSKEKPIEEIQKTPSASSSSYVQYTQTPVHLPDELKKIGIENPQDQKLEFEKEIKLPIPDEEILSGEHAPFTSSLRWLATLCVYILKKAHITLQIAGGKVIRRKERG